MKESITIAGIDSFLAYLMVLSAADPRNDKRLWGHNMDSEDYFVLNLSPGQVESPFGIGNDNDQIGAFTAEGVDFEAYNGGVRSCL